MGSLRDLGKEHQKDHGLTGKKNGKEVWEEKQGNKSFVEAVKGADQAKWKGPTIITIQQYLP